MIRTYILILITAFTLISCGKNAVPEAETPPVTTQQPQPPANPNEQLHSSIPSAEGWSEIIMVANSAKTTVDSMAHFKTSRNACGYDAYGAVPNEADWKEFVESVNLAMKDPLLTEEKCFPSPQELDANGFYKKSMDGTADIKLADGSTRPMFTNRGGEICTNIANQEAAKGLLKQLDKMVLTADKEDCPNGWGSSLR